MSDRDKLINRLRVFAELVHGVAISSKGGLVALSMTHETAVSYAESLDAAADLVESLPTPPQDKDGER